MIHFMASASPPSAHARSRKRRIIRHSLLANFLLLLVIFVLQLNGVWSGLSRIGADSFLLPQSVILTDANGTEIRRMYLEQDRLELADEVFPLTLKQAVIAIEDERYYERSCIDLRAIARALKANALEFKSQGASTITQQLMGNIFLDRRDKSFARKIIEILLSCRLEHTASRDRILGLYLNHMAFGGALYGAEEASQTFFGVNAQRLSLAQSAVLAALLQRPTYFSPYGIHLHTTVSREVAASIRKGFTRSVEQIATDALSPGLLGTTILNAKGPGVYLEGRTDLVLKAMQHSGFITDAQRADAVRELRTMRFERRQTALSLPYFTLYVQKQLNEGTIPIDQPCDAKAGGCIVQTTLDLRLQALAEEIVLSHAGEIREKYGARNMALIATDRATGHILAYIGNVSFSDTEPGSMIDMARIPRQPGSSFKPFVYATVFEQGMTPNTFLLDAPITLGGEQPRNYEGGYRDWTSVSHALAASRNIPAIRALLFAGGEEPVLQMAARAGVTTPLAAWEKNRTLNSQFSFGYPLAIGSAEVPLLEMVQGYSTLANAGVFRPLSTIRSVTTVDGKPLDRKLNPVGVQMINPLHARWLPSILSDTSIRPTPGWNKALTVPGIQTAIKTGTSNRCVSVNLLTSRCTLLPGDVWTVGYTPEFVLGIWMGNADYTPLTADADGMNVVAPLWKEFIAAAHKLRPEGQTRFPPELIEKMPK